MWHHMRQSMDCHARIWLVAIGFSLLYSTIFARTWRVYAYIIFHYFKILRTSVHLPGQDKENFYELAILTILKQS